MTMTVDTTRVMFVFTTGRCKLVAVWEWIVSLAEQHGTSFAQWHDRFGYAVRHGKEVIRVWMGRECDLQRYPPVISIVST